MTAVLALLLLLGLQPVSRSSAAPRRLSFALSRADRTVALRASRLGARSPAAARHWLGRQSGVRRIDVGIDHRTLDVHFRDGGELLLLARTQRSRVPQLRPALARARLHVAQTAQTAPGKAIVLEPFADSLGLGPNAGQPEIDSLKAAGFSVDVLRNSDVTVAAMEGLSSYSVVYMETHSGVFQNGDAIILTRQTDTTNIASLFADDSVAQGIAYGDTALYVAIKAKFIQKHMGQFPASSLIYLNGCEVLTATQIWNAFQSQNVATLVSWDNKVLNTLDEEAADFMFPRLALGETIAANIKAAQDNGLGSSTFDTYVAHLGFLGDGTNTLDRALHGSLPTATPTVTPTSTPTATPTATATPTSPPKPRKHTAKSCKRKSYHRVHGKCVRRTVKHRKPARRA